MARRYRPFDFERGGPFEPGRPFRVPPPSRRFWAGVSLFVLAIFVFVAASPVVTFITDIEWYDALGLRGVFLTRVALEWAMWLGSFALAFLYLAVNVFIAQRVRSGGALRAVGIRRSVIRSPAGWVSLGAAVAVALILSFGASAQWQSLALFMHSTPTGTTDPVLGQDISFYLLTLPFLHVVGNWALGLDFLAILLIAALYAWRGDAFDFRPTVGALAHVSVLIAAFAVTLAATAWIGRYDLLFAHNSTVVWGAAYTDINARLPLYTFQAGLGVVLAGALVANAWLRRLWVPAAAAAVWIAVAVVGQAYPGLIQSLSVTPNAQAYELPYIQREIAGTQAAYGLSDVKVSNFSGDQPLTAKDVQADQVTVNNLRLWDYTQLAETYQQQQAIRTYYAFHDIDIDRYTINGQYQQLEISGREIDTSKLSAAAQNWTNDHLQYTHGYGAAASPVNAVVGEGLPASVVGDLPPSGPLKITQPAIYFGEVPGADDYDIAPSSVKEFDYPLGSGDAFTNYAGTHGVPLNATNRALWALRLGDKDLLVTQQLTEKSQMLYRRNIRERAQELAPFLTFDSDPYIVIVDGRIYWVLDAYTTADTYPYAQAEDLTSDFRINYIRNSVKVVIDAYEGTADFYIVDAKDPIIKAYQATFPALFKPIDSMPAGLRAHLRVPEGLFNLQVIIYATYHVTPDAAGAKVLFAREDVWAVPTTQSGPRSQATTMTPYYVLFRLPGEDNPEFLLIMPYTPLNKSNLVSWLAARSDGTHYGQYTAYVLPKDKTIFGPQQVANRINANTQISSDFTLFDQAGSEVQQGNLLVVPIGNSFLYFEPVYLRAKQTASLPELKRIILVDQDTVAYATNLDQAIQQLVGGAAPPTNQPPVTTYTPQQVAQIQGLIAQANEHYQAAYNALKRGDLTTFSTEMAKVGQILQQLQAITGGTTSPTPSPSPSPKASPSP
ncbi:MAG: UPF0182 family protein [Chloroflexi bacterium]|nr:MAG: UPF0182 family protein [Chloroflexota bacterium]